MSQYDDATEGSRLVNIAEPEEDIQLVSGLDGILPSSSSMSSVIGDHHQETPPLPPPETTTSISPSEISSMVPSSLSMYYQTVLARHFVTWSRQGSNGEIDYTSIFVCPFSREYFVSGSLLAAGMTSRQDDLNWYTSIRGAIQAASARATDCFEFRNNSNNDSGSTSSTDRSYVCEEAPYTVGSAPPLPHSVPRYVAERILQLQRGQSSQADALEENMASAVASSLTFEELSTSTDNDASQVLVRGRNQNENPKAKLYERYQNGMINDEHSVGFHIPKEHFVTWQMGRYHTPSFTCIFVCPRSGELFSSGKLISGDDDFNFQDGFIWYPKKKRAEEAAAARAFDCFEFRQERGNINDRVQFCNEAPYEENEGPMSTIPPNIPQEYLETIQRLQNASSSRWVRL